MKFSQYYHILSIQYIIIFIVFLIEPLHTPITNGFTYILCLLVNVSLACLFLALEANRQYKEAKANDLSNWYSNSNNWK